jgi:hypothetical protein
LQADDRVLFGPYRIYPGDVARVVERPDKSGYVETWNGRAWIKGGATFAEILDAELMRQGLSPDYFKPRGC